MTEQEKEDLFRKVVETSDSIWKSALKASSDKYKKIKARRPPSISEMDQMIGRIGREYSGVEAAESRPKKGKTRWRSIDDDFTS